jgi:hypothetical protein
VSAAQERELATAMSAARAEEYRALAEECAAALESEGADRARALRRLRVEWRAIGRRDFFPPAERDAAGAALRALAAAAGEPAAAGRGSRA